MKKTVYHQMIARITGTVTVVAMIVTLARAIVRVTVALVGVVPRAQKALVAKLTRVASRTKNEIKDWQKIYFFNFCFKQFKTEFAQ